MEGSEEIEILFHNFFVRLTERYNLVTNKLTSILFSHGYVQEKRARNPSLLTTPTGQKGMGEAEREGKYERQHKRRRRKRSTGCAAHYWINTLRGLAGARPGEL